MCTTVCVMVWRHACVKADGRLRFVFCFVLCSFFVFFFCFFFFFQAEDGIRYLVRSRGLGDVYKRQSSIRPLRHAGSQGRSQVRPKIPGNTLDSQLSIYASVYFSAAMSRIYSGTGV